MKADDRSNIFVFERLTISLADDPHGGLRCLPALGNRAEIAAKLKALVEGQSRTRRSASLPTDDPLASE